VDELDRLRAKRDEAQEMILKLLWAPVSEMSAFTMSKACDYLGHPRENPFDPGVDRGCRCGRFKATGEILR
jgi:hypothetical protein